MASTSPTQGAGAWAAGRSTEAARAGIDAARWAGPIALGGVVLLAFVLNAWSIGQAGYGNTYYAAAVRSMTMSFSNFFFGAFDPGGYITVDKPPVFLWFGAISARIFGYSSWSILLPSAVAGAASVGVLWLIVRRYFGVLAATASALVLALTPIAVAVNRLNLPEPFFILMLLGAAGAVLRSLESPRWWAWTAAAGLLVGLAFNSKMLAAWIPGPAFALALVVAWDGTRATVRPMLGRLAVLGVTTLLVSASWMLVVDNWPADSRPYIGGSTNNTVQDLVLGYNGIGRIEGEGQMGGGGPRPADGTQGGTFQPRDGAAPTGAGAAPTKTGAAAGGPGGGMNGAGGIIAGNPSLTRMFDAANGGQIAWLLPLALLGSVASMVVWRRQPVLRAAIVLFAGWVVLYGGVFSYAQGIYHSYYTAALAPGIAALVGISVAGAIEGARRWPLATAAVTAGIVGATLYVQLLVSGRVPTFYGWMQPYVLGGTVLGLGLFIAASRWQRLPVHLGLAVLLAALLALPGGWSVSEASHAPLNTTLPQAGPREGASGRTFGSQAFDDGTTELAAWLRAHGDPNATWDLVVQSAMGASTLVAEHELSVMALGGFSGRDAAITVDEFAQHVAAGDVRYVSTSQGGGPGGGPGGGFGGRDGARDGGDGRAQPDGGLNGQTPPRFDGGTGGPQGAAQGGQPQAAPGGQGTNSVLSAVRSACTAVTDSTLPTQYQGSLYDCAGKSEALAAAG
ncbi:MAG: glycosyltransferase family 39 protein [Dehalococcoidia bacterium]|nr:glycosyltransferase family 39 protein [Dehalococcoidia bacterium]